MGTLTIRNLDDAVVERLKMKAKANNRSLEAEVRAILSGASGKLSREEFIALSDRLRAMAPKGVKQTDSVEIIREMREERMRRFEEVEKENAREKKNARRR